MATPHSQNCATLLPLSSPWESLLSLAIPTTSGTGINSAAPSSCL